MSKGRTRVSLQEIQERAATQAARYWKQNDPRRYEGIEQCFKNVVKCNCANKLKYCKAR